MAYHSIYVYGKHALREALMANPKSVERVYLVSRDDAELLALIRTAGAPITIVTNKTFPRGMDPEANHQGVIGEVNTKEVVVSYDDFRAHLKVGPDTCLVLLNELQDPHNVGAIIRSAAAFGVAGILIPPHNQAPITGTVAKVSAGMTFRVPLVSIGNVNTTIEDLKKQGFWIYGLDEEGSTALHTESFATPTVFVLGNEARGIREKTKEHCDILLNIPMTPDCESLNVAASAAVVLYDWSRKHPDALKS